MASAQDLRKRIKKCYRIRNKLQKAMKMVASARLRKAQTKAEGTRILTQRRLGKSCVHMSNSDLEGFSSPLLEVNAL